MTDYKQMAEKLAGSLPSKYLVIEYGIGSHSFEFKGNEFVEDVALMLKRVADDREAAIATGWDEWQDDFEKKQELRIAEQISKDAEIARTVKIERHQTARYDIVKAIEQQITSGSPG